MAELERMARERDAWRKLAEAFEVQVYYLESSDAYRKATARIAEARKELLDLMVSP